MSRPKGIVGLSVLVLLCSCGKPAETAEQICSAGATYDKLKDLIADKVMPIDIQNGAESGIHNARELVEQLVGFRQPVVSAVDDKTKRIDCHAILRIRSPRNAAMFLASEGVTAADIVEVKPAYLDVKASYSVQPTADTGTRVYTLAKADEFAMMALIAGAQLVTPASSDDTTEEESEAPAAEDLGETPANASDDETPAPDEAPLPAPSNEERGE